MAYREANISSITFGLLGNAALTASTTPTSGTANTGYWYLPLPFSITFLSNTYNGVSVGTNSYLLFGGNSTSGSSVSRSNPAFPKIMIAARDNSAQRLYYGTEGSAPNRTYRIRFEGNASTSGTLGSPGMVWETKFYENNNAIIDVHIGTMNIREANIVEGYTPLSGVFSNSSVVAFMPGFANVTGNITNYANVGVRVTSANISYSLPTVGLDQANTSTYSTSTVVIDDVLEANTVSISGGLNTSDPGSSISGFSSLSTAGFNLTDTVDPTGSVLSNVVTITWSTS